MKATGIVRRIDDLGRVVIPKETRRTMRIREGDPVLTTLTPSDRFYLSVMNLSKRMGTEEAENSLHKIDKTLI
jgi:AbrB family looped-hinge helix DNA binding protein